MRRLLSAGPLASVGTLPGGCHPAIAPVSQGNSSRAGSVHDEGTRYRNGELVTGRHGLLHLRMRALETLCRSLAAGRHAEALDAGTATLSGQKKRSGATTGLGCDTSAHSAVTRCGDDRGVEALGDRRAAVIVTLWTHGGQIVGRIRWVQPNEPSDELGQAYRSAGELCDALCAFIDEFAEGAS